MSEWLVYFVRVLGTVGVCLGVTAGLAVLNEGMSAEDQVTFLVVGVVAAVLFYQKFPELWNAAKRRRGE
ncbi:MAG: hypothetical protein MR009_05475 [Sutterellaceae bacterium]|nr:hypothetical protein [Sutterellaceae bacterium]MDD7443051.1 hypothetical protein [Sutterellaceae bacterium]MDY2867944.1 hypothetical protein [Mesosutterella sp.]